jgi:hypothetical protein
LIQKKKRIERNQNRKRKKGNRKQKREKPFPPLAGPSLAQPAPRPLFPPLSFHGPHGPAARAAPPPDSPTPLVSDPLLPPPRVALSLAAQARLSASSFRPCLTGAFAAERLTPRHLAIKARPTLSDHRGTVTEPSPHPSPARAVPIADCSIPAMMASSSALTVPSIPLPLPSAYKRSRPSPVPSTPAPAASFASPRAN